MKIGIGFGLGPFRIGLSNRGAGLGFGPFSVGGSWRRSGGSRRSVGNARNSGIATLLALPIVLGIYFLVPDDQDRREELSERLHHLSAFAFVSADDLVNRAKYACDAVADPWDHSNDYGDRERAKAFDELTGSPTANPDAVAALNITIDLYCPEANYRPTTKTITGNVMAVTQSFADVWVTVGDKIFKLADIEPAGWHESVCDAVPSDEKVRRLLAEVEQRLPVGTQVSVLRVDENSAFIGEDGNAATSVNADILRIGWAGVPRDRQDWWSLDWFPEAATAHAVALDALRVGQTAPGGAVRTCMDEQSAKNQRLAEEEAGRQQRQRQEDAKAQARLRELARGRATCTSRLQTHDRENFPLEILGSAALKETLKSTKSLCESSNNPLELADMIIKTEDSVS